MLVFIQSIFYNEIGDTMQFTFHNLQYDTNDQNKYNDFICELATDKQVKRFMPRIKGLCKKINKNSIYNNSYVVTDIHLDVPIGYVHLYEPNMDEINLLYAVHPDFRGFGYGKNILGNITEYILEKDLNINKIGLIIHFDNLLSSYTALSVGYISNGGICYIKKR